MHFYFITRGIQHQVDQWKTWMQTQSFTFPRVQVIKYKPDGTPIYGNVQMNSVQGALRPIQMWEYVFPHDSLKDVLVNMKISKETMPSGVNKYAWLMKKALQLKDIPDLSGPEYANHPLTRRMWMEGVAIHPIGIKEDTFGIRDFKDGLGEFEQEFL